MDLIAVTRFDSISRDLHRLEDKLKQSGIQSLEVKFKVPGSSQESSVTLFDQKAPISPITQQFASQNYTSPLYPNPPQSVPDGLKVYHPRNPPPHTNLKVKTKRHVCWKILSQIYRGFSIGFLGKLAFNLLPLILKQGPLALFSHLSLKSCLNPTAWGLFSGSFLGIFHSIMTLTKNSKDLSKHQRSFISAFAAAWSLLWVPRAERTGIAVFMFVRGLEITLGAACAAGIIPSIPHADSLLFGISTAQIVFAWIFAPWVQDSGYNRFLDNHTGNRAQGSQQALAYLHMIPSNEPKHSPIAHRSPLGQLHQYEHSQAIINIPGGHLEGCQIGYPKLKGWEKGLNLQQTIDFYAKRRGKMNSTSTTDPPYDITPNFHPHTTTSTTPNTNTTTVISNNNLSGMSKEALPPSTSLITPHSLNRTLSPSNIVIPSTQRPSPQSLLPEELIQTCNYWHKQRGQAPLDPQNLLNRSKLICQVLHPSCPNSCLGGQLSAYPGILLQGVKTYAPVYLIPGLLFRYQTMLNDPRSWLEHIVFSTFQSGLFFSNMTLMSHVFSCYSRHFLNAIGSPYAYHYYLLPGLSGVAAFLAILLEQKPKRIELALFSLGHAIKGITNLLLVTEKIPLIPWASTALFACSIAVLISAAMTNPVLLRSSYFSLLRLFLGKETPGLATPARLLTTTQLIDDDDGVVGDGKKVMIISEDTPIPQPTPQLTTTTTPTLHPQIITRASQIDNTRNHHHNQQEHQTQWIKDVILQDLSTQPLKNNTASTTSSSFFLSPPQQPSTLTNSTMKHIESYKLLSPALSEPGNSTMGLNLVVSNKANGETNDYQHQHDDMQKNYISQPPGIVPETDLGSFHRLQRRTSLDVDSQSMLSPSSPQ